LAEAAPALRRSVVLLPAPESLRGGLAAAPRLAQVLGRGDLLDPGKPGRDEQLHRHFRVLPRRLPVAPLTRCLDADDAQLGAWLRCDPAHVRADMATARLVAFGEALQLDAEEATSLIAPLRPLFGDSNAPISAPHPSRWYASIAEARALPSMASPDEVLGADLLACLPAGQEGLRWRQLWNEAQVILHQHPVNARRVAAGKLPVNSLWFWGGGTLPDSVECSSRAFLSTDPLVQALAARAGVPKADPAGAWQDGVLIDLCRLRDVAEIEQQVLPEAMTVLASATLDAVDLDFADGRVWRLRHGQRWRFWRRAIRQ